MLVASGRWPVEGAARYRFSTGHRHLATGHRHPASACRLWGFYNCSLSRRRFFVDAVRDGMAELRGDEARHLTRVLRVEAGMRFEVSDNQAAYLAEIVEARGERVVFRIVEPLHTPALPVAITLCAALIKFDRFEWMIEKATELGVARILPVESTRSERGLFEASRKRTERWVRIARESSQQSRRVRIPEILPAVRFEKSLALEADHRYFLDEGEGECQAPPFLHLMPAERPAGSRVAVLVGPEGGWTDAERQLSAVAGWLPVSLGPQVLRAETAASAAVAVLMNAWIA
jgi:16S rRNA (uracil1498-N3)-methyltransferase